MYRALYIVNSVCILFLLLSVSVFTPTFSLSFYSYEYDKHNIPESIQVPKDELMTVTVNLLNYMKSEDPALDAVANVNGQTREFFNQKEKDHMVDVKSLFSAGFLLRDVSLIILLATIILTITKNDYLRAAKTTFFSILAYMAAIVVPIVIISMDFNHAFNIFHEIFFTNDLWMLDASTDLLVNIVPLPFFIDIAECISILFTILNIAVLCGLGGYIRRAVLRKRS